MMSGKRAKEIQVECAIKMGKHDPNVYRKKKKEYKESRRHV